jgi:uncharacterized damage-inducible protein DinB
VDHFSDANFENSRKDNVALKIDEVRVLYDYTYWATEKILETVAHLSEAQFNEDLPNGVGSIRVTLVHMLSGHWIWRERWEGNSPSAMLRPQDFPALEMIRFRWWGEKQRMDNLLATLGDEDLEREVEYNSTMLPGQIFRFPLWQLMIHLVNHGTHHRSEIAMKLTELGHSPGELDMNYFLFTHFQR